MSLQDWFLFSCYNPQTPHMNVMEQLLCLPLAVLGPMYAAIRYKAEEFRLPSLELLARSALLHQLSRKTRVTSHFGRWTYDVGA